MHISLFLALLAIGLFAASTASAETVFVDNFVTGNFSRWTQVDTMGAEGKWQISTTQSYLPYSGQTVGATGASGVILRKSISTDTYKDLSLSFHYRTSSFNYDVKKKDVDRVFLEYSVDGANWTVMKEINTKTMTSDSFIPNSEGINSSWRKSVTSVPTHPGFQFRLRAVLGDSGDRFWVDAVNLSGTPMENSPDRCKDKIDNDADGKIDKLDSDCAAFYSLLTVYNFGLGQGVVTSSPAGISCGLDCVEEYFKDVIVTLKSAVTRGFEFVGWGGDCSGLGDCVVSMDEDREVTANFSTSTAYTLTVENAPQGAGTVTAPSADLNCGADCIVTTYQGETISLVAEPAFGFTFREWSGDCVGAITTCLLTIEGDAAVTAHYDPVPPGVCGNAVIEWDEQCDQGGGNVANGDGCSSSCQIEPPFTCFDEPSVCFIEPTCTGYVCSF